MLTTNLQSTVATVLTYVEQLGRPLTEHFVLYACVCMLAATGVVQLHASSRILSCQDSAEHALHTSSMILVLGMNGSSLACKGALGTVQNQHVMLLVRQTCPCMSSSELVRSSYHICSSYSRTYIRVTNITSGSCNRCKECQETYIAPSHRAVACTMPGTSGQGT
jgi:hypothetical protein